MGWWAGLNGRGTRFASSDEALRPPVPVNFSHITLDGNVIHPLIGLVSTSLCLI